MKKYRILDKGVDIWRFKVEKRSWDTIFPIWVFHDTFKTLEDARACVEQMKDWDRREVMRRNPKVIEYH